MVYAEAIGGTQITSTTKYTTAGNQTIYAGWQIITYQVTYNANGGTGAPGAQTKTWGQTLTLSSQKPTRNGYTFINWNTQANGTGTNYNLGANYTANAGVILYAIWKQDYVLATTAITTATYGDYVNYNANGINSWRIFLNDKTYIYIISNEYVPNKDFNGVNKIGDYEVWSSQSTLINWLSDTSNWTRYSTGFSGAIATGGPTISQFWNSYNAKHGSSYSKTADVTSHAGYNNTLYFPHKSDWNDVWGYWTYDSSTAYDVECFGKIESGHYNWAGRGCRPLVKLPANIYAMKGNDNKWTFKK